MKKRYAIAALVLCGALAYNAFRDKDEDLTTADPISQGMIDAQKADRAVLTSAEANKLRALEAQQEYEALIKEMRDNRDYAVSLLQKDLGQQLDHLSELSGGRFQYQYDEDMNHYEYMSGFSFGDYYELNISTNIPGVTLSTRFLTGYDKSKKPLCYSDTFVSLEKETDKGTWEKIKGQKPSIAAITKRLIQDKVIQPDLRSPTDLLAHLKEGAENVFGPSFDKIITAEERRENPSLFAKSRIESDGCFIDTGLRSQYGKKLYLWVGMEEAITPNAKLPPANQFRLYAEKDPDQNAEIKARPWDSQKKSLPSFDELSMKDRVEPLPEASPEKIITYLSALKPLQQISNNFWDRTLPKDCRNKLSEEEFGELENYANTRFGTAMNYLTKRTKGAAPPKGRRRCDFLVIHTGITHTKDDPLPYFLDATIFVKKYDSRVGFFLSTNDKNHTIFEQNPIETLEQILTDREKSTRPSGQNPKADQAYIF